MPASTVEDQYGDRANRDIATDLREMLIHGPDIHLRHDDRGPDATRRAGRTEEVSPGETMIPERARGREPRMAQTRVRVPCWPTRASSWNQNSDCQGRPSNRHTVTLKSRTRGFRVSNP